MKNKSGSRTMLMSVLMSSPGPIVVGIGLFMGKSSTQLADFIRRSAELLAIIVSYIVYTLTYDEKNNNQHRKAIYEHYCNLFVGAVMCLSGITMLLLTVFSKNTEKGNVLFGLIIALLGVVANTIFWFKYLKLSKQTNNAILAVQSRLYRAKALVDFCVTTALGTLVVFPGSIVANYMDIFGTAVVALYLFWCGIKTIWENKKIVV